MILIKCMPGVFIQSVIWDPKSRQSEGIAYDMTEYIVSTLRQAIFKKEYIELATFGVAPFFQTFYDEDSKPVDCKYIIKTKRINLCFSTRQLADEYYYMLLNHFYPDIEVLEVREQFKV